MAAGAALEDGVAANLGGGTHHAFAHAGRGFCVFNDVVTAIRELRSGGRVRRVLVVDVDVHQGDGTHALSRPTPTRSRFPSTGGATTRSSASRVTSSVDLPDRTGDERYLDELAAALPEAIARARARALLRPGRRRPLRGRPARTPRAHEARAAERDVLVRDALAAAGVPVCVTLAGGYAAAIRDTVEINLNTLRVFA